MQPTILVVGNDPNRAECLPSYVKGDEQRLFQKRRNFAEIGKIALGVRTEQGGIAVQDRAAWAKFARRSPISVRSPLSGDGAPVEASLLIRLLQKTKPRRVRATQDQGGIRQPALK